MPARATPRWRRSALALAAALTLGGAALDAHALGLGRVTVLSTLGEPLRAEIDIPQAAAEEVASLRAGLADAAAFKAAGMDLSPLLASAEITLQRRPNGSYFLRLVGDRPVTEPFIELVLEANWANGRIVREYTMLFDPPSARVAPAASLPAQISAAPAAAAQAAAVPAPVGSGDARVRPAAPAPATPSAPAAPRAAAAAPAAERSVTVRPGDSAGSIAGRYLPRTISLDQMLLALLRGNPDAFIAGNVNRLRAGAVLQLPTAEEAGAVNTGQARQMLVAQSRDFNEFRRRLAQDVPAAAPATPARSDSGAVQAQVQERSPAASAPDRLTLSKGAAQARGTPGSSEDQLARARAAQDNATRLAELNRNLQELDRLRGAATAPAGSSPGGTGTSAAAAGVAAATGAAAAPAPVTPPAATASSASPGAAAGGAPVAAARPASAPARAPAAAAAKPGAEADTSLLDDILNHPLASAAGGAVAALLLGLALFRLRRRRKGGGVDSSFLESRLQPDSFFGASGGQRIDTAEGASVTGSSMVYSPSQLDAAGDVDPVAEADVYLAYGRDLQAEEILKEALRTNPDRVAIHQKLLEIYARRRDVKAFEQTARDVQALTAGTGPIWTQVCAMGSELEPANLFYRSAQPPAPVATPPAQDTARASGDAAPQLSGGAPDLAELPPHDDFAETGEVSSSGLSSGPSTAAMDLDLDLDLDLGAPAAPSGAGQQGLTADEKIALALGALEDIPAASTPADAQAQPATASRAAPNAGASAELEALTFDLDGLDAPGTPPASVAAPSPAPELAAPDAATAHDALSLDLSALDAAPANAAAPAAAPATPATGSSPDSLMDFDLDSLSLDLDAPAAQPQASTTASPHSALPDLDLAMGEGGDPASDPLATKLALAEEFSALGDADGARSLAQEVLAEASGELRERAERLLADIG